MPAERLNNITISALSSDGQGIAFLPGHGRGKAVFVRGALPGQNVDCETNYHKKNYISAKLINVNHGPELEAPLCSHTVICGGCPLQLLPYPKQLQWKQTLALNTISRIGKFNLGNLYRIWKGIEPSPKITTFRNKIEFAIGLDENNNLNCGFRKAASHAVFTPGDCILMDKEALSINKTFKDLISKSDVQPYNGKSGFWRFLILRRGIDKTDSKEKWFITCITSKGNSSTRNFVEQSGRELLQHYPSIAAFIHEERSKYDLLALGEQRITCLDSQGKQNGKAASLIMHLGNRTFELDTSAFFQVNSKAGEKLANLTIDIDWHTKGNLLDLYCGVGAPGQLLAKNHNFILGIESGAKAVQAARANARAANIVNSKWLAGKVEKLTPRLDLSSFSTILLDPPRQGVDPKVLQMLLRILPDYIIYISCNPATFARDSFILKSNYNLCRLESVDMFPHTPHLELCSLWTKNIL